GSDLVAPIEQNRRRSSAPARILRLRHGQRWPEDGMRYGILAFSESLRLVFIRADIFLCPVAHSGVTSTNGKVW
ncbi:MAG: hypothetical protein KKC76_03715, partial [Proteobacteria bacterium]|nr:hypothetical protein [Pseudomonadota bacterium]MBU4297881.1 hypothetical protein [Pseudomonadota bacterium]